MTPTVGRVVHYYPVGCIRTDQPLAAIIAHVWSPTCVNLAIFGADGKPWPGPPTSISLVPGEMAPTEEMVEAGNYCVWPPRVE